MHNFTPENVLQFLYHEEASTEETSAIKLALNTDWDLKESFEEMKASKQLLSEINFSPRVQTINAILNYAEASVNELS